MMLTIRKKSDERLLLSAPNGRQPICKNIEIKI